MAAEGGPVPVSGQAGVGRQAARAGQPASDTSARRLVRRGVWTTVSAATATSTSSSRSWRGRAHGKGADAGMSASAGSCPQRASSSIPIHSRCGAESRSAARPSGDSRPRPELGRGDNRAVRRVIPLRGGRGCAPRRARVLRLRPARLAGGLDGRPQGADRRRRARQVRPVPRDPLPAAERARELRVRLAAALPGDAVVAEKLVRVLPAARRRAAARNAATRALWLALVAAGAAAMTARGGAAPASGLAALALGFLWGLDEAVMLCKSEPWTAGQLIARRLRDGADRGQRADRPRGLARAAHAARSRRARSSPPTRSSTG